jgi:lipopolysaccharide biosynthesis protein
LFVHLARRLEAAGYKSVLKLHTKKSTHRKDGGKWFEELINNLLPSKAISKEILNKLSISPSIVGPQGHYVSLQEYMGSNQKHLRNLIERIYGDKEGAAVLEHAGKLAYFGGSMFWASLEAIKPVLDLYLMPEDFESEAGQIDGTMAHALERLIGIVCLLDGRKVFIADRGGLKQASRRNISRNYKYVK